MLLCNSCHIQSLLCNIGFGIGLYMEIETFTDFTVNYYHTAYLVNAVPIYQSSSSFQIKK